MRDDTLAGDASPSPAPATQGTGASARLLAWRARLRILAQGLRWRWVGTVALLVVSVVAVAGSALGPAFERAADASAFTTSVADTAPGSTDVSVITTGGTSAFGHVRAIDDAVHRLDRGRQFFPPVLTVDSGYTFSQPAQAVDGTSPSYSLDLLYRSDVCAHVRLVAGTCPARTGQAAISARSARLADLHLGERINIDGRDGVTARVLLSAVYDPPADTDTDYWDDTSYFAEGTGASGGVTPIDALLTTAGTALGGVAYGQAPQVSSLQYLRPGTLYPTRFSSFHHRLQAVITAAGDRYGIVPTTALFGFLASARHDDDVAATVIEAVVLQLVLLALLVLSSMVSLGGADRRLEVEIARRRGFTRPALLGVAVGEPLAVLVVALPVGLGVAAAAMALIGRGLFVRGTPSGLDGASLLAAAVAFAGGVAAAVVGSSGLWRGVGRHDEAASRRRSAAAATDAFALALAAAGLVGLSTRGSLGGSHPDPLVALAPGLVAIGAGVIGLRLAGLAVRLAVRLSGQSRRVALFLALRDVARRQPATLRQLLALSVAVVLVVFTVSAAALAAQNRSAVARFQTGADRVLDVHVGAGVDLVSAVRAADPSGREAMAAEVYQSNDGELLAVDAARLAAVMPWPTALTGLTARQLAHYLAPPVAAPIEVTGDAVRITATLGAGAPATSLSATITGLVDTDETTAAFGTLHPGTATYTASLEGFCRTTCRLAGLTPTAPTAPTFGTTTLAVDDLEVETAPGRWHPVPFGAGRIRSWEASPSEVSVTTRRGSRAVSFSLPNELLSAMGILVSPVDTPTPLPAVVTDELASVDAPSPPDDAQTVPALDGLTLTVAGEVQAATLPGVGSDAAMVDLPDAILSETAPPEGTSEVWLAHPATPALLSRLRARGVTVTSTVTTSARTAVLGRSPLALAYRFVLDAAPVAALLGLGAATVALLASRRRRRADRWALRAIGIAPGTVVRAALAETGIVLGSAWLVGSIAGVVASRLALDSLPQFADGTGGIPIDHAVPALPAAAAIGVLLVLFVAVALTTTAAILGRGRADGEGAP